MIRNRSTVRRQGSGSQILFVAASLSIVLPLAIWVCLEKWWGDAVESGPLTCTPQRGTFLHEVTGKGTLECASNVEVESEADAKGFYTTIILEVVPEGTYVEPGDFLMRLDSSPLEELLIRRKIEGNELEAGLVQAENELVTARIMLEEYIDGLLPQSRQLLDNELATALEELRKAEQTLSLSQNMYRQGFVTQIAVEADEYSAERAKIDLKKAETKLHVLKNYTSKMKLKELESRLAVAEATVSSRRHTYSLALEELDHIEEQIGKCLITAPAAGNVVYVNDNRGNQTKVIEPGAEVWEHRVVFRLPNSEEMQVKVRVPEEKIALVSVGQSVRIRCEAFPGVELTGRVDDVEQYASRTEWWMPQIKAYETTIAIDLASIKAAGIALRPGLSTEVSIQVDRREEQLMLPFQAVLKHGSKDYCLIHDRHGFHAREIKVGATNGKFVVVRNGLEGNEPVVLGAANYRSQVELPD